MEQTSDEGGAESTSHLTSPALWASHTRKLNIQNLARPYKQEHISYKEYRSQLQPSNDLPANAKSGAVFIQVDPQHNLHHVYYRVSDCWRPFSWPMQHPLFNTRFLGFNGDNFGWLSWDTVKKGGVPDERGESDPSWQRRLSVYLTRDTSPAASSTSKRAALEMSTSSRPKRSKTGVSGANSPPDVSSSVVRSGFLSVGSFVPCDSGINNSRSASVRTPSKGHVQERLMQDEPRNSNQVDHAELSQNNTIPSRTPRLTLRLPSRLPKNDAEIHDGNCTDSALARSHSPQHELAPPFEDPRLDKPNERQLSAAPRCTSPPEISTGTGPGSLYPTTAAIDEAASETGLTEPQRSLDFETLTSLYDVDEEIARSVLLSIQTSESLKVVKRELRQSNEALHVHKSQSCHLQNQIDALQSDYHALQRVRQEEVRAKDAELQQMRNTLRENELEAQALRNEYERVQTAFRNSKSEIERLQKANEGILAKREQVFRDFEAFYRSHFSSRENCV